MSVWDATSYKLDIAKSVYECLPNIRSRILGETVGNYLQPKGYLVPFDDESEWDEVALYCGWIDSGNYDDTKVQDLVREVTNWRIGTSAVYALISAHRRGNFAVRDQYPYAKIRALAETVALAVVGSTAITEDEFVATWSRADASFLRISEGFDSFSESWKYYSRNINLKGLEFAEIDQVRYFGIGNRVFYGGNIGPLIIMVGSGNYRNIGLVMTKTHISFLVEASARIANIVDHYAREYYANEKMRTNGLKLLDLTITTAFYARGFNADKVVQAFHKARAYMQMVLFDNQIEMALEDALNEFQKKTLQTIMDLGAYVECFRGVEPALWLELLHIYKWMPPPDYDATYAFTELFDYHLSTRPSGLDPRASTEMRNLWALIVKERKLNIAVAYKRMTGNWPAGLETEDDSPIEASLDEWDPSGLFAYYAYGTDVVGQIKDKSTVAARLSHERAGDPSLFERNFLMWYLNNKSKIDTKEDASKLMRGQLREDNYARVAYKGEAHKPGSRLFFMAPPRQRILLGELEGNISRIAHYYPASLQGVDALAKAKKLEYLFDVYDEMRGVDHDELTTCYIVTFDLSKFSPRFNPKVLLNLHEFWASVFNYEPIVAMGKIGSFGDILHTTGNLKMQYSNRGADLEGFRGRMMTLFHADLIAAACRYAQKSGCIVGKAVTAVFIDDGAVRVNVPGDEVTAKANALRFLECLQKVYAAAGQENHPNKTIVSKVGGELLAEQYLHGQQLRCPVKAGMRLYPTYENPVACITEEFDSAFSTVQGSVRDGATWVIAYRRLCDAYLKSIYRWSRKSFSRVSRERFAIKLVTPKSFGGFGFPTLQALTTTAAYDITSEGLSILNTAARCFAVFEPLVYEVINRPIIIRDPVSILRDPGRVRVDGSVLIESRMMDAILDKLSTIKGECAFLVAVYRDEVLRQHAREIAICLLDQPSVSLTVLKRVWGCLPLAYVEGVIQKFKRSATIQTVLGEKGIIKVRKGNTKDVHNVLNSFP